MSEEQPGVEPAEELVEAETFVEEEAAAAERAAPEAEEVAAVEEEIAVEQAAPEEEKAKRPWYVVAIIALFAVLVLCVIVTCCGAGAIYLASRGEETPAPILPPEATAPPAGSSYIRIEEPVQGAVVDISQPVKVSGSGGALPEGNVVVHILDAGGNVLAEGPAILQGPDVGTGGEGTWSIELSVTVEPGTAGTLYAFSPSPLDGSIVASDQVQVSLGQTSAVEAYIRIEDPANDMVLDASQPVTVRGTGAGLPEGNVVVQAQDQAGNVLAHSVTILQGPDVGTGGEGTWSAPLNVQVSIETVGTIVAFATSPDDGSLVAGDRAGVTFSTPESGGQLEGQAWLLQGSLDGTEITALFEAGQVSGSAGCNQYFGGYTLSTGENADGITFSELGTTRMACAEDVMGQEQAYLGALGMATGYTVQGDTLSIYFPGGTLIYTAVTAGQ